MISNISMETFRDNFNSLPTWAKYAIVAVPSIITVRYFFQRIPRPTPVKTDWEEGIVYLYQYPRPKSLPSLSPFCVKLETWLRMTHIKYETIECAAPFGVRSKEGTLPFVELNGLEHPDSTLAIRDLTKLLNMGDMEAHLTSEQQGYARAIENMIENSIWMSNFYVRVMEKMEELAEHLGILNTPFMRIIRFFMKPVWRRNGLALFSNTYIGKHERDEIVNIGCDDIRALSKCLGNKNYLMGQNPTKVDATAFGILSQIIYLNISTPHKDVIDTECTNIKDYCERIKATFWSDWDKICTETN